MTKYRFLFASVDSSPKVGGVSLLAKRVSSSLLLHYGKDAVYLGPKGTYFERGEVPMKIYEDFQSDTTLRSGERAPAEDRRIADLVGGIIDNYSLDFLVLWHPFYYGPGAIAAAKSRNLPSAVFVHGTELTSQLQGCKDGPMSFDYDPSNTQLDHRLFGTMRSADLILTNSRYSAGLIENVVPKKTIRVVGCGIDENLFDRELKIQPTYNRLEKVIWREDLGLPEKTTLIHVGRLVAHKNQRSSIELLSWMPECQLIIIGDGPDAADLEKYVAEKNLQDRVFILNGLNDEEKWKYLRASDVGLLISNYNDSTGGYEGFGITMIEYAAAGCVVASSGLYGMSDFAKNYEGAFILLNDDNSVEYHAERLMSFLADQKAVAEHIDRVRTLSRRRFVWSEVAKRVEQALVSVLQEKEAEEHV